jgi:hypothetical protein
MLKIQNCKQDIDGEKHEDVFGLLHHRRNVHDDENPLLSLGK